jgi:hypothetical protein
MNPDPTCPPYVIYILLGIFFVVVTWDIFKK